MKIRIPLVHILLILAAIILGVLVYVNIKPVQADSYCSSTPITSVSQLLSLTSITEWQRYLEELTGETPVIINGAFHNIINRYTPHMFDGSSDALAFQYVKEQLSDMGYPPNLEPDHYGFYEDHYLYNGNNWNNLILTIPGVEQVDPQELIFSGHLDDLPDGNAPGAEDNGVGAAALLEMARVLRHYQFNAQIQLIWFTGEEQGLRGSYYYVQDNPALVDDLIGVINLDMFGFDADKDRCFEIHAGDLSVSYTLGDCLINVIDAYDLPLTFDYIKEIVPSSNSDHQSFWTKGLAAIEILENHFGINSTDPYQQCGTAVDANPYYHTSNDTIDNSLDVQHAFDIVQASLATGATLSGPLGPCYNDQPALFATAMMPYVKLSWQNMGGNSTYRLYRSSTGCSGPWEKFADNVYALEYYDRPYPSAELSYRIEAVAPSGTCFSLPSNCLTDLKIAWAIFPVIFKGY